MSANDSRMELDLRGVLISLRPYRLSDEDGLARIANNRKIWRNLTDRFPHPYTRDDARDWIAFATSPEPIVHFAIELKGQLVGGAGLDVGSPRSAELGYWLGEAYWGYGYATEAVCLLTEYAFTRLPIDRLQASVYAWNPASMRVLARAGYGLEAVHPKHLRKDGQLVDVHVYVRLRGGDSK